MPGGVAQGRMIATRGSTNGSNDLTLDTNANYDGLLSNPTRSTNTYTITIGPFRRLLSCMPRSGIGSAISSVTSDGAAGTVSWTFGAAQTSTTMDIIICVDRGFGG